MFFRNLTLFRFSPKLRSHFEELDARLDDCTLKPVGPLEPSSRGFVSPFGVGEAALSHRIGQAILLSLGHEERLLPSVVVNDALQKKISAIEEQEGRKVGGRTRKRIKEDLIHELLPKAFVRPSRLNAWVDLKHGIVGIDSSSRKAAENFVTELRHALGSFPAVPINAEQSPRAIMTGWVAGDALPDGLSIGDEIELRDPADRGAVVKCQRQELQGEEIAKHLESGKQVTRLALTFNDHVSFVMSEDLVVRKLKFLDGAVNQLENSERDSLRDELDARFALMSAELAQLFETLEQTFAISTVE
jgi:recombination associated protein RdgC